MSDTTDYELENRPSTAQPPPVHVPGGASIHDLVIAELDGRAPELAALLEERKRFGLEKYETVLQVEDPKRDPRMDLLEEVAGDGLVYAYRVKALGIPGGEHVYAGLLDLSVALAALWYVIPEELQQ
jgi:hypothetical protein